MKFVAMPRYQMRKNALKKLLLSNPCIGNRVLEIGYGAGEVFELYRKLGLMVEGYDTSETAYKYAASNDIVKGGNDIVLLKEKPKVGKKYDYVIACEVLEHIKDDVETLKEWKRYLKDTGKMIISVPAHQKRWGWNDVYSGHYRRYEKKELTNIFSKAGMCVDVIYTYDFPSCLFLDVIGDISRKRKISRDKLKKSRQEYTETSGIERDFHPIFLALSHPFLWFPIIKAEELFYKTDWGSAYILIASPKW